MAGGEDTRGVSRENVEVVRGLLPPPGVDFAPWFRDDAMPPSTLAAFGSSMSADVHLETVWAGGERTAYTGMDGLRALWLDWLEPWETYRTNIEELIDRGERVVVLVRDRGRRARGGVELEQPAAAIWTLTDGLVSRVVFYAAREDAFRDLDGDAA